MGAEETFDTVKLKLVIQQNGNWSIQPQKVVWNGIQTFSLSLGAGPQSPHMPVPPPQPAQPFELGTCTRHLGKEEAMLSYTPNTIDSWKPAFERKISMTQVMEVDGFGQSPLTIELEFQQQVSNFLVRTAVHVAAAFTALLASIALLFKRRPPTALPPRADEPEGREPSASTR